MAKAACFFYYFEVVWHKVVVGTMHSCECGRQHRYGAARVSAPGMHAAPLVRTKMREVPTCGPAGFAAKQVEATWKERWLGKRHSYGICLRLSSPIGSVPKVWMQTVIECPTTLHYFPTWLVAKASELLQRSSGGEQISF